MKMRVENGMTHLFFVAIIHNKYHVQKKSEKVEEFLFHLLFTTHFCRESGGKIAKKEGNSI